MKTYNNDIEYLKKVKKLLINIDMINGFVKEGTLAAPSIMRIVPRQIELLEEGLINPNSGIIFVRDAHSNNAQEFNTFPKHCLFKSEESKLINELKRFEPFALTYLKNSTNLIFAPFFQYDLSNFKELKEIDLMGCLSEICVLNGAIGLRTYFDQVNRDVIVGVYADAIDTYDAPNHPADKVTNEALKLMENNGVKILRKEK